ncbi:MAG: hypothetical protein ACREC5_07040 [Thermoplasmata archaeon]
MPRTIEFGDDVLVVRFTGLVHYATLTEELRIPYRTIRSVSTDSFEPPKGTLRWYGTDVPYTDIREGRFGHGGERYFFSVEDRRRAVTLYLEGYAQADSPDPLRVVVLGTPDPPGLKLEIEKIRDRVLAAKAP